MLRRVGSATPPSHPSPSPSRLIASIMLYGLAAEGKISTDISIQGKLEGVHVQDITPTGKRYPDILVIGAEEKKEAFQPLHCLSFSLNSSPQSSISLAGGPPSSSAAATSSLERKSSDVHLCIFIPAIHYLHSVNFVYEVEMFVSEFMQYFVAAISSVKSAAVGVAKGLVSQESQLAKGLSRLHTSFGHTQSHPDSFASSADLKGLPLSSLSGRGVEETDLGVPFTSSSGGSSSRLYYDVSIQSPVIVFPSSLSREDCLVAHLGEITAKNEYLVSSDNPQATLGKSYEVQRSSCCSPSVIEQMTISVSNISLHATHSKESREKLERSTSSDGGGGGKGSPAIEGCTKVLREISVEFQLSKRLSAGERRQGEDTVEAGGKEGDNGRFPLGNEEEEEAEESDIVITGKVCDSVLIELPKSVFDQIRVTLKHGIRRKPRRKKSRFRKHSEAQQHGSGVGGGDVGSTAAGKTVQFDPVVQFQDAPSSGGSNSSRVRKFPKISASFTLPNLSLELKHIIDQRDRNLVHVSFDDLSIHYQQSHADFLSLDLALKSIVIEDLLQPADSEYRKILASTTRPTPFPLSPVTTSNGSSILRKITNSSGLTSSFSPLFPLSHLMSTPKPPSHASNHSPLRSFSPAVQKDSFTSSLGQNETGSTIKGEQDTLSASPDRRLSTSTTDLLTIKAFYVSKKHPFFKEKYDSVSPWVLCVVRHLLLL